MDTKKIKKRQENIKHQFREKISAKLHIAGFKSTYQNPKIIFVLILELLPARN